MNEQELDEKIGDLATSWRCDRLTKNTMIQEIKQACFQARDKWVLREMNKIKTLAQRSQYDDLDWYVNYKEIRKIFKGKK